MTGVILSFIIMFLSLEDLLLASVMMLCIFISINILLFFIIIIIIITIIIITCYCIMYYTFLFFQALGLPQLCGLMALPAEVKVFCCT